MGKSYLIEHCIQEYNDHAELEAYRTYHSDMLRVLVNGIASMGGSTGIDKSWMDILNYKPETRTAEEVEEQVLGVLKNLGD